MGALQEKKIFYDSSSLDSPSFAFLLSDKDQQPKSPPNPNNQAKHNHVSIKQSPEFEFASTKLNSNSAANAIKITPAHLLISNGKLQPQTLVQQEAKHAFFVSPPTSLGSLLAAHSRRKISKGQQDSTKQYGEQLHRGSKQTSKESNVTKGEDGWKLSKFKGFVSPCWECSVVKPEAVKAETVRREYTKIKQH